MKSVALLLFFIFTAQGVFAEDKKDSLPWKPEVFADKIDKLPANYEGVDKKQLYRMFKEKVASVIKGEFETTSEFVKRTASKDALLAPINTSDLYAFKKNMIFSYNADAQAYTIGGKYDWSCRSAAAYGNDKDWFTCNKSAISQTEDTYVGSNAYGATFTVKRIRGNNVALAILKGTLPSDLYSKDQRSNEYYNYQDLLPVPLEKARTLKDNKLSVLFIGQVTDARLVKGSDEIASPTIDYPTDRYTTVEAIPFKLRKIIYYVYETGEILHQRAF